MTRLANVLTVEKLVGLAEVAELLGVGRARADQLARQRDFPLPVQVISAGRIWRLADIETWARERGRTLRPH